MYLDKQIHLDMNTIVSSVIQSEQGQSAEQSPWRVHDNTGVSSLKEMP